MSSWAFGGGPALIDKPLVVKSAPPAHPSRAVLSVKEKIAAFKRARRYKKSWTESGVARDPDVRHRCSK